MPSRARQILGLALAVSGPSVPLSAQTCVEREQPLLSGADEAFLEDFGAARARFQGMELDDFAAQYSVETAYRTESGLFIRGDANGDAVLDVADVTCILGYLFLGSGACEDSQCTDRLDADDSGELLITDALFLLTHLFLGGREPPAPFATAGEDPTEDALPCAAGKLDYDPMQAANLELITAHYPLNEAQEEAYREHGFVIREDGRIGRFETFFNALADIFQNHVPVYISVDVLLDALHLSYDAILIEIEEEVLFGALDDMLEKLDGGVEELRQYAGGFAIDANLDDVAFWICTARSLLRGEQVPCQRDVGATVAEFLAHIASERVQVIDLFRSPCGARAEDFSQFRPRGHYTRSESFERYFRTMMWVQRIGMDFSQADSHAAVAYLLAQGLHDTGAIEEWRRINDVVELFVGMSDSLTPPGMVDLVREAEIGSVADFYTQDSFMAFVDVALERGAGRQRIMSQLLEAAIPDGAGGFLPPPPAFHVMGQRFIVDSYVFTNVIKPHVENPPRFFPSPLDAWFVLGNRATLPLLRAELEEYSYQSNLASLDWIVSRYPEDFWQENLYNVWLSALRTLNVETTQSPYPSVMQTRAWSRRILNTQLASWAHLRHDTILYAKQSVSDFACDFPDAWVDPYPEFYKTLALFAERASAKFGELGLAGFGEYFTALGSHSRMLEGVARAELQERALTEEQSLFVRSAVKLVNQYSSRFNGWYTDLVYGPVFEWFSVPEFEPTIADVHTFYNAVQDKLYFTEVGVGRPQLMLLSVKTNCATRSYIGPVLSYYEFVETNQRLTDEQWATRLETRALRHSPSDVSSLRPAWTDDFIR
jgi:hypothetical protein